MTAAERREVRAAAQHEMRTSSRFRLAPCRGRPRLRQHPLALHPRLLESAAPPSHVRDEYRAPPRRYSTWPFSFSVRGIHGLLPMLPGGSTADSCVGFSRLDILCDKSRPYDSDIDDTGTLIFSMLIAIGKPAIMVITFLLHTNFNVS